MDSASTATAESESSIINLASSIVNLFCITFGDLVATFKTLLRKKASKPTEFTNKFDPWLISIIDNENMSMNSTFNYMHMAAFGIFVGLYFFYLYKDTNNEHGPIWAKCAPIWQLALLVLNARLEDSKELARNESGLQNQSIIERKTAISFQNTVIVGLLLSSVGDALLEVETKEEPLYFIGGLLFFLIAHVCYIKAFKVEPFNVPYNVLGSIAIFLLGLMFIVLPKVMKVGSPDEPDYILRSAIVVYGSVISLMTLMAVNRLMFKVTDKFQATPTFHSRLCAVVGALVFMSSDCVIAINKFVIAVPRGKWIIMVTYYMGQLLIARSAIYAKPKDPRFELFMSKKGQ